MMMERKERITTKICRPQTCYRHQRDSKCEPERAAGAQTKNRMSDERETVAKQEQRRNGWKEQ